MWLLYQFYLVYQFYQSYEYTIQSEYIKICYIFRHIIVDDMFNIWEI